MDFKKKMKKFFTMTRKADGGFTLVELIVVIAILAILGGVAVPAYSGYVEKADRAADAQLLADVNKAFVSACIMAGENNVGRTDVKATVNNDGTLNYGGPFQETFGKFYEGGAFRVVKFLEYDKVNGCFVEAGSKFSTLFNTLKEKYGDAIANKILNTNLGAIKTEDLFDQLNGAMDVAAALKLADMGGSAFVDAYFSYLGFDPSDYSSDEEAQNAFDAKLAALGVDDATASTNAIALYAAQNSAGLTIDRLNGWLGKGNDTGDLQNSPSANTLAEAGALYGMYLSYQQKINGTVPTGNALNILNEALSDNNFANWVSTSSDAQAELDAYKTYMEIVNEAGKDENTRNEILANGFQNPELESLMKDLMGK